MIHTGTSLCSLSKGELRSGTKIFAFHNKTVSVTILFTDPAAYYLVLVGFLLLAMDMISRGGSRERAVSDRMIRSPLQNMSEGESVEEFVGFEGVR